VKKVLVFGQDLIEENKIYCDDLFTKLQEEGIEIYLYEKFFHALQKFKVEIQHNGIISSYEEVVEINPEFVITLGGDGTILNAVTLVRDTGIPIIGINLGRLGFLAIGEKTSIGDLIDDLMQGHYKLEKRSLLSLDSNTSLFGNANIALNDFTIHKYASSSVVVIHTYVDDNYLNSYWADGLIVATPTGSTGYSMSCGGPIVLPGSGNFVITPVAPHHLTIRPIVIPDTSVITFRIEGRSDNFLCTLDARYKPITSKHKLSVRKAEYSINLVVLEGRDFIRNIYNKLHWGKDSRKITH
jgi:NAD+ kinase